MSRYFYFHGYGSDPLARKCIELKELVGADNVTAPHFLNDNIDQVHMQLKEIITELQESKGLEGVKELDSCQKTTIVGSSMGALYALYVSCFTDVNVLLLNPCLMPLLVATDIGADVDNVLVATELSMKSYKLYDPLRIRVWVTDDDELINHRYLSKPFFHKAPLEYRVFKDDEATNHGFEGFKEVFRKYFLDQSL